MEAGTYSVDDLFRGQHFVVMAVLHLTEGTCQGQRFAERFFALKPNVDAMWKSFFATVVHQGSLVHDRRALFMTFEYLWQDLDVIQARCVEGLARYKNVVIHEIATEVTARRKWASACQRAWICAVVC
jgi:hypothetical protein